MNVEFRDDGRYELTCIAGHRSVTLLQEGKYEILFEIGLNAIVDGYYREAVTSFAASLERFYELSIRVLLTAALVSEKNIDVAWKQVARRSERQLGAFIFLWLRQFSEVPTLLAERATSFRNEVVHRGKIPSRAEAIEFGDEVLKVILPKLLRLDLELPGCMHSVEYARRQSVEGPVEPYIRGALLTTPTVFRLYLSDPTVDNSVPASIARVERDRGGRTNG